MTDRHLPVPPAAATQHGHGPVGAWPAVRPPCASPIHGRRKGRKLRARQAGLVESLLPRLAIDLGRAPLRPEALFAKTVIGVRLEVGFGGGEHIAMEASRRPEIGFIGCDPFVSGIAKALALIEVNGLDNIRLHQGDAGTLIDRLPEACLERVYVLYPDPWPKRRHRKRRFMSDTMLLRLARVMTAGAELRFATDIDDYAGWTLARILRSSHFRWTALCASDWAGPWANWAPTRYEEKAKREGRTSGYFTFVRR